MKWPRAGRMGLVFGTTIRTAALISHHLSQTLELLYQTRRQKFTDATFRPFGEQTIRFWAGAQV